MKFYKNSVDFFVAKSHETGLFVIYQITNKPCHKISMRYLKFSLNFFSCGYI